MRILCRSTKAGISQAPPRFKARLTGAAYLLYFLTAMFAELLVGSGHATSGVAVNISRPRHFDGPLPAGWEKPNSARQRRLHVATNAISSVDAWRHQGAATHFSAPANPGPVQAGERQITCRSSMPSAAEPPYWQLACVEPTKERAAAFSSETDKCGLEKLELLRAQIHAALLVRTVRH
jgi:hypothetical protein